MSASEYESPQHPEGCPAVVPLSDGVRLILGDGSVVRIAIEDAETRESFTEVVPATAGESIFSDMEEDGARLSVGLPTDDEAAQHPAVRESLRTLGFLEGTGGGDD